MSDPVSVKLARRRVVCWLWLPAILAVITVGVGCFITIDYDVKAWYYDRSDPERRPERDVSGTETDRLFAFNFHPLSVDWWFPKPASWVRVVERRRESLGVSVPESMDSFFLFWGGVPLVAVAFGYWPSSKLVAVWTRYRGSGQRNVQLATATQTVCSVIAVPLGLAAWMWLLGVLAFAVCELLGVNENVWYLVGALLWAAPGWWVLVSLVGYGILARQDRAKLVVGSRLGLWVMAVILSLGGPTVVAWGFPFV